MKAPFALFARVLQAHRRWPVLWTVVAFVLVASALVTLSVWWNFLLIENQVIVERVRESANTTGVQHALASLDRPARSFALWMVLGILCSVLMLIGLLYFFVRLIAAIRTNFAQTQFISSVTHELKTPVSALKLMLEAVRDPSLPKEIHEDFLKRMSDELARLQKLVDEVLDTTRLESAPRRSSAPAQNLNTLVSNTVTGMKPLFQRNPHGLQLKLNAPPSAQVLATEEQFRSILENLIANAIKYSPAESEIQVTTGTDGTRAVVRVTDNGVGIEASEIKKIFRRFYRVEQSSHRPGTGLGLYFSQLAARELGGTLRATSRGLGQGSTFELILPLSGSTNTLTAPLPGAEQHPR